MNVPHEIIAGDSYSWFDSFAGYPSDQWTLQYAFQGASALVITATAATDSDGFNVILTAQQTAVLTPGIYEWAARVASGSEAHTIASGRLDVKPNLMTAAAGSRLHHVEKTLAAIEAALEGRITEDVVSISIAGRSITQIGINDLLRLRAQYKQERYYLRHGRKGLGQDMQVVFRPLGQMPLATPLLDMPISPEYLM